MKYLFACLFVCCIGGWVLWQACGVYSFTDASIPPEVKSIRVNTFKNEAVLVNPQVAVMATTEFINKVRSQTKLYIVNDGTADYEISATITAYNISTTNINNNQTVTNSQLTITINYNFINHIIEKVPNMKNGDFPITVNQEFDSKTTFSLVENDLLSTMIPQITNQAFNKIFSAW